MRQTKNSGDKNQADEEAKKIPVKVNEVHFKGISGTKHERQDVLGKVYGDILESSNLYELLQACDDSRRKVSQLNLYKAVEIVVDSDKSDATFGHSYDVTVTVHKHTRPKAYIGVESDGKANHVVMCRGSVENVLGGGEALRTQLAFDPSGMSRNIFSSMQSLDLHLSSPINLNPNLVFLIGGGPEFSTFPNSHFKETSRSIYSKIRWALGPYTHSLDWTGAWRETSALDKQVDLSIRENFGHHTKSALAYVFERDTRDHPILPNHGSCAKLRTELAGLGGDAKFVKCDLKMSYYHNIFKDLVLGFSSGAGFSQALDKQEIPLTDRFYFDNWANVVRGFNSFSFGPVKSGCLLGGNSYVLGGVHVFTPLPFIRAPEGLSRLVRLHAWVNSGSLVNFTHCKLNLQDIRSEIFRESKLSYGIGLVANLFSMARLEVNLSVPVQPGGLSSVQPKWQFGIVIP